MLLLLLETLQGMPVETLGIILGIAGVVLAWFSIYAVLVVVRLQGRRK